MTAEFHEPHDFKTERKACAIMSPPVELYTLPPMFQDWVGRELKLDEHLVWIGQPIAGLFTGYYRFNYIAQVIMGVPFTIQPIIMSIMAIGMREPLWVAFFPFPFFLCGLILLSSPFLIRRRLRKTVYAITDRRAIIFDGGIFATKMMSFAPEQLLELNSQANNKDVGYILFSVCSADYFYHPLKMSRRNEFFNITQVGKVEQLLKNLAATSQKE